MGGGNIKAQLLITGRFSPSNIKIVFDPKMRMIKSKYIQQDIEKCWKSFNASNYEANRPLWNGSIYRLNNFQEHNNELQLELGLTNYKEVIFTASNSYKSWDSKYLANGIGLFIIIETLDNKLVLGKRTYENNKVSFVSGLVSTSDTNVSNKMFHEQAMLEMREELGIKIEFIHSLSLVGLIKSPDLSNDFIFYSKLNIHSNYVKELYLNYNNEEIADIIFLNKNEQEIENYIVKKRDIQTEITYEILDLLLKEKIRIPAIKN